MATKQDIVNAVEQVASSSATTASLTDLRNRSYSATMVSVDTLEADLRGSGSFRVSVRGTWTGVLFFENTINDIDWISAVMLPYPQVISAQNQAFTPFTQDNGQWVGQAAAFSKMRVRASISGSAEVFIEVNHAVATQNAILYADGNIDVNNSSFTPLAANASFVGAKTIALPFVSIGVTIFSDQDSATTGCFFEFSADGINWDIQHPFFVRANSGACSPFIRQAIFFRVVYKNGPVAQTAFRLMTIMQRVSSVVSEQVLSAELTQGSAAALTHSVIAGKSISDPFIYKDVAINDDGSLHVAPVALPPGSATEAKQDAEIAALGPLATQATLLTRTKPSDQQHTLVDASALPTGAATEASLILRTKPSDQQHAIVDSSALPVGAATETTLLTRLKPADTLAAVTVITNPVTTVQPTFVNLNAQVDIVNPTAQIVKQVEPATIQTGVAVWTPAAGKKVSVTSTDIVVSGGAVLLTLWYAAAGVTVFVPGTHQPLFRGQLANNTAVTLSWTRPRAGNADDVLKITTSVAVQVYVTCYGFER